MQLLGKHIPAEAYARKNNTSIARQRISKQAFSRIETLCFLRGPCRGVIKGRRKSFESCFCQELGRVLEMAVQGDWEQMAKKELDCAKKTSHMIWSDSETVINLLPGHDLWRLRILARV
jgi:hypothetical protein